MSDATIELKPLALTETYRPLWQIALSCLSLLIVSIIGLPVALVVITFGGLQALLLRNRATFERAWNYAADGLVVPWEGFLITLGIALYLAGEGTKKIFRRQAGDTRRPAV